MKNVLEHDYLKLLDNQFLSLYIKPPVVIEYVLL